VNIIIIIIIMEEEQTLKIVMMVAFTQHFPYLFNPKEIYRTWLILRQWQAQQEQHTNAGDYALCLFLVIHPCACWIFFWCVGYIYTWFFTIPWCLLRRVVNLLRRVVNRITTTTTTTTTTSTSSMSFIRTTHANAMAWAFWSAHRFTALQGVLYGVLIRYGYEVDAVPDIFVLSLIIGAFSKGRSSSFQERMKSMFCFGGLVLMCAMIFGDHGSFTNNLHDANEKTYSPPPTPSANTSHHSVFDNHDGEMRIEL